jgi:hypothetical protein
MLLRMFRGRGRFLAATLVLGAAVVGITGTGSAASICLLGGSTCPGILELDAGADVLPRVLPRGKPAAIGFRGQASISTSEGSHPSALREAILEIDRDVVIDAEGLPACGYRKIASRDSDGARQACPNSLVGSGEAVVEFAYPENTPIAITTEIGIFNGGVREGRTRLFIHGFVPFPIPRAVVARVEIRKRASGRYLREALIEIPRMGDGHGSLVEFELRMRRIFYVAGRKKSFLSGRCPDGRLDLGMSKALFKNENRAPGVAPQTMLKGLLTLPCTPKGPAGRKVRR